MGTGLLIDLAMNMAHMQRDVQQASRSINRFSKDAAKDLGHIKKSFSGLTMAVKTFAASFITYKLTAAIKDTALLTARVETLGIVLEQVGQNVGYSRDQMFEFADGVKSMGITTQESRKAIIRMVQANLDLTKSHHLARVAQDAAVIGSINSSEAMQRLIHGIVTLNPRVLKHIGILVDFQSEYAKAAAQMNRTSESLSVNEKQQIAFNAAIKAGENIAGSYTAAMGTVGKQIGSLPRPVEELKLKVGELFKPSLTLLVTEYTQALKDADDAMAEFLQSGDAKKWGEDLAAKLKTILETLKGFKNLYDIMPKEVIEAGILGAILFGKFSPLRLAGAIIIINDALSGIDMGIGTVIERYKEAVGAIDDFWDALTGKMERWKARGEIGPETPGYAEFIKSLKERRKAAIAVEEALSKVLLDLRKKFNKESKALYKFDTDFQLEQLNIQYVAYQKAVEDKTELERWFQREKQRIEAEGANRSVKLYQELYKATADEYYARLATEAFQKVLDAEMAKNTQILKSEEDAFAIRFLHNQQFLNDLYKSDEDALANRFSQNKQYVNDLIDLYGLMDISGREMAVIKFDVAEDIKEAAEDIKDAMEKFRIIERQEMQKASEWSLNLAKDETQKRYMFYADAAGKIAGTFQQIAQAGGKQSEKSFRLYQGFAMTQAYTAAAAAYVKTLAEPALPWPGNIVMAKVIAGMAAVQIGLIAAAKPPSGYKAGGWITGGSGSKDDVLLGLTPGVAHWGMGGEFMVNKKAARENATWLEHINNESYASGGWVNKGYGWDPISDIKSWFTPDVPETGIDPAGQMIENLNETIRKLTSTLSDLGQEVDDIIRKYEEELETAKELGVSLDLVAEARTVELEALKGGISEDIHDIIDSLTMSGYELEMKKLTDWYDDILEGIIALAAQGIDTTGMIYDLTDAYSLQAQEAKKAAIAAAELELKKAKNFENMIRELSHPREQWGVQDFINEFDRLTDEISGLNETSENYLGDLLDLTREQVGILDHLEDLSRQTVRSLESSISSIDDMLMSLRGGELAPVQSMEFFQGQYEALRAGAGTEEGLAAFQSFIPQYLEFMSSYGIDYAELVGAITTDLEGIQTIFETQLTAVESLLGDISQNTENTTMELVGLAAANNLLLSSMSTSINSLVNVLSVAAQVDPVIVDPVIVDPVIVDPALLADIATATAAVAIATAALETAQNIYDELLIQGGEIAIMPIPPEIIQGWLKEIQIKIDAAFETIAITQGNLDVAIEALEAAETAAGYQHGGFTGNQTGLVHPYEWIVPTKEPEASNFLQSVGADPVIIGNTIAERLLTLDVGGKEIHINLVIDGKKVGNVVANQIGKNRELNQAIKGIVH